jgi:hypothetical protein
MSCPYLNEFTSHNLRTGAQQHKSVCVSSGTAAATANPSYMVTDDAMQGELLAYGPVAPVVVLAPATLSDNTSVDHVDDTAAAMVVNLPDLSLADPGPRIGFLKTVFKVAGANTTTINPLPSATPPSVLTNIGDSVTYMWTGVAGEEWMLVGGSNGAPGVQLCIPDGIVTAPGLAFCDDYTSLMVQPQPLHLPSSLIQTLDSSQVGLMI